MDDGSYRETLFVGSMADVGHLGAGGMSGGMSGSMGSSAGPSRAFVPRQLGCDAVPFLPPQGSGMGATGCTGYMVVVAKHFSFLLIVAKLWLGGKSQ